MHFKHTTGRGATDDPYHIEIIREKLMRTLPAVLPDVLDELTLAVPAFIPTRGNGERKSTEVVIGQKKLTMS